MAQIKFISKTLIIFALLLIGCKQVQNQPFEKVLGEWKSVKLAGNDIGDFIKEISISFLSDSSLIASAVMRDSTVDVNKGYFDITSDSLVIIAEDKMSLMKYSFSKDTLIIYDPSVDSRVYLLKSL